MWLARDKNDELWLYCNKKPILYNNESWIVEDEECIIDATTVFDSNKAPDLKWYDEPMEVFLVKRMTDDVKGEIQNEVIKSTDFDKLSKEELVNEIINKVIERINYV